VRLKERFNEHRELFNCEERICLVVGLCESGAVEKKRKFNYEISETMPKMVECNHRDTLRPN
jgi:hypothetical protein